MRVPSTGLLPLRKVSSHSVSSRASRGLRVAVACGPVAVGAVVAIPAEGAVDVEPQAASRTMAVSKTTRHKTLSLGMLYHPGIGEAQGSLTTMEAGGSTAEGVSLDGVPSSFGPKAKSTPPGKPGALPAKITTS